MKTIIFSTKKLEHIGFSNVFAKTVWKSLLDFSSSKPPNTDLMILLQKTQTHLVFATKFSWNFHECRPTNGNWKLVVLLGIVEFWDKVKIFKMRGKNFLELVTESIEFYELLRYCFAMKSFSSFVVHISNIFNSFFSLRRYLRSFVKSVVKWNMENIADIVHGRDRLQT